MNSAHITALFWLAITLIILGEPLIDLIARALSALGATP